MQLLNYDQFTIEVINTESVSASKVCDNENIRHYEGNLNELPLLYPSMILFFISEYVWNINHEDELPKDPRNDKFDGVGPPKL